MLEQVKSTGSANDHEETEFTEEITVKASPIKPKAKASATALKGTFLR